MVDTYVRVHVQCTDVLDVLTVHFVGYLLNFILQVPVTDPCSADGMAGCQFDVSLSPQQNTIV